jgi:hypothetical protein
MSLLDQQKEQLHFFVLDALGTMSCLVEPSNDDSLAFDTIDHRIGCLQQEDPERAFECGVPALDDPLRQKKIRKILEDMRREGLAHYRLFNRWSFTPY